MHKMYKNIAMQVKIADEVIKEVGVREGNIIGQQTAAATTIIRSHKLIDSDKEAKFIILKNGDLVESPPNEIHTMEFPEDEENEFVVFFLKEHVYILFRDNGINVFI